MKTVTLIDGNNYVRRKFEQDKDQAGLRAVLLDIRSELARANNQVIFVFDGKGASRARREIFPGYKVGREPTPDSFFEHLRLLQRILSHVPIISIEVDGTEADDIIAHLVHDFRASENFGPQTPIHIKSTDKDFHQLGVTYEGKDLGIPPEQTVLYKVMVGDSSDKIPGIPGFGIKKFEALDKDAALSWLEAGFPEDRVPPMPEACRKWCESNAETLRAYRDICRFFPVRHEDLMAGTTFGKDEPQEIEKIFKELMI